MNPKHIVERAKPIKPKPGNDIIKHEGGDGIPDACTTYQGHYVAWKGAVPAKTFQIKQLYIPNAGEMDFQSIQRLHFRGTKNTGGGGLSVAEVKSEMFDANMLSGDVHEKVSCFKTNLTNVLKLLYLPRK